MHDIGNGVGLPASDDRGGLHPKTEEVRGRASVSLVIIRETSCVQPDAAGQLRFKTANEGAPVTAGFKTNPTRGKAVPNGSAIPERADASRIPARRIA